MIRPLLILCALLAQLPLASAAPPSNPNVVIVFCDDLGWGDIGVYGAANYKTPNIDRLAAEGVKFNDFYCAQAVCSASRVGLLTGCYPNRVGILGALGPGSKIGRMIPASPAASSTFSCVIT